MGDAVREAQPEFIIYATLFVVFALGLVVSICGLLYNLALIARDAWRRRVEARDV